MFFRLRNFSPSPSPSRLLAQSWYEKVTSSIGTARLEESRNLTNGQHHARAGESGLAESTTPPRPEPGWRLFSSSFFRVTWPSTDVSILCHHTFFVSEFDPGISPPSNIFVTPTLIKMPNGNKKDNKSGSNPSTASQGKKFLKSAEHDHDSSIDFIEDEFDAYEPPRTRGSKGTKASGKPNQRAHEFLKTPGPKSKTNLVKIKQEPISPVKQEKASSSTPRDPRAPGSAAAPETPLPFHDKEGIYASLKNYSDSHPGSSTGSQPGSLMAAKPGPVGNPEI